MLWARSCSGVGIIALIGGIGELGKSLTSPIALGGIGVGIVLLVVWFIWESHNENRFFPVSLFKNPVFLAAIAAGFIYNFGNAVVFLQMTNLWQYINGLKTLEVSLWQLPLLITGIVIGLLTGRADVAGRLSAKGALLLGGSVSRGRPRPARTHPQRHVTSRTSFRARSWSVLVSSSRPCPTGR